jgi:membrane associated rhomboid family serine protease
VKMAYQFNAFLNALKVVLIITAFIWCVEIINLLSGHSLYVWGILPRNLSGLIGVPLHPFIHGSLQHAVINTIPLIILGAFVAIEGKKKFIRSTLIIIFVGGGLLWLLGRPSFHIGASLLVFGYFGFILANAFYKKSVWAIIIAVATFFLYGGLIYGILPLKSYVSWEGHLFGLMAGILAARKN